MMVKKIKYYKEKLAKSEFLGVNSIYLEILILNECSDSR